MNGVGDDCAICVPKVTTAEDVKDVPVPQWKKDALAKGAGDTTAAPFGASWDVEANTAAIPAPAPAPPADMSHNHKHSHGHDHGHYNKRYKSMKSTDTSQ
jgi:hypothetical protein